MSDRPHISVCVCTYKRPDLLKRCLETLCGQDTGGLFTYSVVVVDNDQAESSRDAVAAAAETTKTEIKYVVEPQQNIPMARNTAVASATGDFIVFLDDDELAPSQWLLTLFRAYGNFGVNGVLGPVKPHFDDNTPAWVIEGRFYDRPSYPTGTIIDYKKGRTGNVLLERKIFQGIDQPFRPQFRVGEDQDFFRRMIDKGYAFVWCHEAIAYEIVPPIRWNRKFMWRRALLRGATSLLQPTFGFLDLMKSVTATVAYALILPFALLLGQGRFMNYSIRLCDHLGKVLAAAGVNPVKGAYVTE